MYPDLGDVVVEQGECPVCYEEKPLVSSCPRHTICRRCKAEWSGACPTCRAPREQLRTADIRVRVRATGQAASRGAAQQSIAPTEGALVWKVRCLAVLRMIPLCCNTLVMHSPAPLLLLQGQRAAGRHGQDRRRKLLDPGSPEPSRASDSDFVPSTIRRKARRRTAQVRATADGSTPAPDQVGDTRGRGVQPQNAAGWGCTSLKHPGQRGGLTIANILQARPAF